jgi:large subunit ribosomal protein L6
MSRIAKRPIAIPAKTEVSVSGSTVTVKGPLGELSKDFHSAVGIEVKDGEVHVTTKNDSHLANALSGTFASHIKNMLAGVNKAYVKKLILDGIGYRMAVSGSTLTLSVGFSHPVVMKIPEGVTAVVEKTELTLSGIDKEVLGQFAANVRAQKKPEPYKGKGFHYSDETILRKQGKKAA